LSDALKLNAQDQSGFALVIVLSLVLLMSLFSSITYRYLRQEQLITAQLISRDDVFIEAEKRLHECGAGVAISMPAVYSKDCCFIERSTTRSNDHYFRVSVHVIDPHHVTGSQSRQQQLVRLKVNASSKQIEDREVLSWREILDPKWDKEIDQSPNSPWESITPCLRTQENIL
jgi:hypothetical protein